MQTAQNVIDSVHGKAEATNWKERKSRLRRRPSQLYEISAVEGIRLKPAMKKRAAEAASKGLSAEEYRRTILRSYRKG
jgi:hypothetical protein